MILIMILHVHVLNALLSSVFLKCQDSGLYLGISRSQPKTTSLRDVTSLPLFYLWMTHYKDALCTCHSKAKQQLGTRITITPTSACVRHH